MSSAQSTAVAYRDVFVSSPPLDSHGRVSPVWIHVFGKEAAALCSVAPSRLFRQLSDRIGCGPTFDDLHCRRQQPEKTKTAHLCLSSRFQSLTRFMTTKQDVELITESTNATAYACDQRNCTASPARHSISLRQPAALLQNLIKRSKTTTRCRLDALCPCLRRHQGPASRSLFLSDHSRRGSDMTVLSRTRCT